VRAWSIVGRDPWPIKLTTILIENVNIFPLHVYLLTKVDIIDVVVDTINVFSIPSIVINSVDIWSIVDQFLANLPVLWADSSCCNAIITPSLEYGDKLS